MPYMPDPDAAQSCDRAILDKSLKVRWISAGASKGATRYIPLTDSFFIARIETFPGLMELSGIGA